MNKFRISKYNPIFRDEKGIFLKDDWTSYSDIGRKYGKSYLKKEDYLVMENKYCEVIYNILSSKNVKEMRIEKLEKYFSVDEIYHLFREKGLEILDEDRKIFTSLENGKYIPLELLKKYLRLLLRESFWCEFISDDSLLKLVFGYDYYVYVYCDFIDIQLTI